MKKNLKIIKRYENNPILSAIPDNAWENLCVLNPAAVYDEKSDEFVMLYRAAGNDVEHIIQLGLAVSNDGFNFRRLSNKPVFSINPDDADGGCIEDPRIIKIEDIYFLTYAARALPPGQYWLSYEQQKKNGYVLEKQSDVAPFFLRNNNTVTYLAMTKDFRRFKRLGRMTDSRFDDRDVFLFPERINGKYVRISRPKYDARICKMYSIWVTYSDDIIEWGEPELLMTGEQWWESAKIGAACSPVKCDKGWFMFYHAVDGEGTYRLGAVILDENNPSKILARTKTFLMEPEQPYELEGLYNKCIFPTANILKDGILYIYYGCADKYIAVATADFKELVDFVWEDGKL